jgi:hypothetical protein
MNSNNEFYKKSGYEIMNDLKKKYAPKQSAREIKESFKKRYEERRLRELRESRAHSAMKQESEAENIAKEKIKEQMKFMSDRNQHTDFFQKQKDFQDQVDQERRAREEQSRQSRREQSRREQEEEEEEPGRYMRREQKIRQQPSPDEVIIEIPGCPSEGRNPRGFNNAVDEETCKKMYRANALIYHPDRNPACREDATEKMKNLNRFHQSCLEKYTKRGGKKTKRRKNRKLKNKRSRRRH